MFSYYLLSPLIEVTTNVSHHAYFNLLDDQVLHFSQHLHDEYAIDTPRLQVQDDNNKVHRAGRLYGWV
jgi:hypothetical protein